MLNSTHIVSLLITLVEIEPRLLYQLLKLTADPIPSTQLHVRETRILSYEYIFIYCINLLIVSQNPYTAVHPMDIGTVKE